MIHSYSLFSFFLIFLESLRKFPPGASLLRTVTKDYQVPDSNVVLKKGMTMLSSIYAIHHDPEIYPDPEVFDPERFTHENMVKRHPMAFIPFGEGLLIIN
jgi:cytochrome P450 family 6